MKKTEYKDKTQKELIQELTDKKSALSKFKFGISGSRTKNVKEGRTLRREVARIMTTLNLNQKSGRLTTDTKAEVK